MPRLNARGRCILLEPVISVTKLREVGGGGGREG